MTALDRDALLDLIDSYLADAIPCRAFDVATAAAWTADEDDEQRVAAAACRSTPCPALEVCRFFGLTYADELGVYGGLTHTQRRRAARQNGTAA